MSDPNLIRLRKVYGAPIQTGSHDAAEQGEIVRVFITRENEKMMLERHWVEVAREEKYEENERELLKEASSAFTEEDEDKGEEIILPPEEEEELENWLNEFERRLKKIDTEYQESVEVHKTVFFSNLTTYGYTVDESKKYADTIVKVLENELSSSANPFIHYPNQGGAHVSNQYVQQEGQTSLMTMLQLRKNIVDNDLFNKAENKKEVNIQVDVKFLIEQKRLSDEARAAQEARNQAEQALRREYGQPPVTPIPTPTPLPLNNASTPSRQTQIPVVTGVPIQNNPSGLPLAQARYVDVSPPLAGAVIVDDQTHADYVLNLNQAFVDTTGVSPTPQFVRCAKDFVEEGVVPALNTRITAEAELVEDMTNDFSPGIGSTLLQPQNHQNESTWKAPVPRPPLYVKPKEE